MAFLISPAERDRAIKDLGAYSSLPEKMGADIAWTEKQVGGIIGVQRKEMSDFIASIQDGRLQREIIQLTTCKLAFIVIEGRPRWSTDGWLMHRYARWSRVQHRSMLRSIQARGIYVESSEDANDTATLVREIAAWAAKPDHTSLDRRPKPPPANWGHVTDEGWACHLLQSVPNIGPKQAKAIYDHFDGVPVQLTVTEKEMGKVKGLGPARVEALGKSFGGYVVGGGGGVLTNRGVDE